MDNPADDVSRGFSVDALRESPRWIQGPKFLSQNKSVWPKLPDEMQISLDDPEANETYIQQL
jgi:hypothetical protein